MDLPAIKLTIELIPNSTWFDNVRSFLKKGEWGLIKQACYARAGNRCEICAGKGPNHPVECHEIWEYDDERHVQTLKGLIALCPACHRVKHIGNTARLGSKFLVAAMQKLMTVNDWNHEVAESYMQLMFAQWHERSRHTWTVNLDWLHANRESYVRVSTAEGREALSRRVLDAMSSKRTRYADNFGSFS